MKILYITGANSNLFANTCMLYDSFKLHCPKDTLWVCDFGLDSEHNEFFKSLGILLPTPSNLQSYNHPWYFKASICDFIKDMQYDAVVWLDADMIVLEPITDRVKGLVVEMKISNTQVSICADDVTLDIKKYIKFVRKQGHSVVSFEKNCLKHKTDMGRQYLNTGFFVISSLNLLSDWRDLVLSEDVDFLFEQNSFNVIANQKQRNIKILSSHEWNAHGARLKDVLTLRSKEMTRILHATSTGDGHAEGDFNLPINDQQLSGHIKLFKRADLYQRQYVHLTHFAKTHFTTLAKCNLLSKVK